VPARDEHGHDSCADRGEDECRRPGAAVPPSPPHDRREDSSRHTRLVGHAAERSTGVG
jgi:hypothetical protein